jgi:uncharacterized protein YukE
MAMLGMDIDAVRSFANQLASKADEIESIVNSLTSQLDGVQWIGTDANNFRNDWSSTHRPQLQTVANALREASGVANNNAVQQEQTSAS